MPPPPVTFGPFVFDPADGALRRDGRPVPLNTRGAALLQALLAGKGRAVAKSALMEAAWPNASVEESNLTVQIAALRKVLGENANGGEWIVTVPRVGYRLAGRRHPDRTAAAGVAGTVSIVVLPFANLSSDPEQEFFADGLTEDLIGDLSRIPGLTVIARNSAFAYKGRPVGVRAIAGELGVRYVIEGSVRRAAERLRIGVQLADAVNGGHLWVDRFDRELSDVFKLQDEIVERVVRSLAGVLPAAGPLVARRTASIAAYDLFVHGRVLVARASTYGNKPGRELLEAAIRSDPDFADAHAWLAHGHHVAWLYAGEPAEPHRRLARAAAERAVALDPKNADARWCLGLVLAYDQQLAAGIAEFETALRINPNHADTWAFMTDLMVLDGQPAAAIDCAERALRLNPHPPAIYYWFLGFAQYAAGKYAEAVATLCREETYRSGSRRLLAAALAKLGRPDEARAEAMQYLAGHPDFSADAWARTQPFRNAADRRHFTDGFVEAGLPA